MVSGRFRETAGEFRCRRFQNHADSGIKDLGDRLERATDLPNRQRVMELAKQLLSLVPPITKNIEWNDEWRRKFARGLDPASPKADQYYNDPRIRS